MYVVVAQGEVSIAKDFKISINTNTPSEEWSDLNNLVTDR